MLNTTKHPIKEINIMYIKYYIHDPFCTNAFQFKLCHFYLTEFDARAEVPWQSHGAGSTVLHETNGNRCCVYSLSESCPSGFEAR